MEIAQTWISQAIRNLEIINFIFIYFIFIFNYIYFFIILIF